MASHLIGLAVGEGTGPELAAVFERALAAWARAAGVDVAVERCDDVFRTFGGVVKAGLSPVAVAASSAADAATYEAWLRDFAARGGRVVFRTAFNAQPLYVVRERLACVKVEALPGAASTTGGAGEILLVRDQTQGFYAGDNDDPATAPDSITRTTRFTRAATWRLLDFARAEALRRWHGEPDHVVMAYKFHLLDTRFATWVDDYQRAHGVRVTVLQPDTMNRNLARGAWRGRVLVVGGNEWGDIMHADLLHRAGLGAQDERCSKNVYLAAGPPDGVGALVEYQTVHGSADDIAGRDLVNPAATLRAAAKILEDHVGVAGLGARVDLALTRLAGRGVATPDVGGQAGTRAVADAVVALVASDEALERHDAALLVIDVQRDFCAPDGRFAALGLIDPAAHAALGGRLAELARSARAAGIPLAVVHTHADPPDVPAVVRERHKRMGRDGYLVPGTPGAEAFAVTVEPGDKHIVKPGYDPFLHSALEPWLRAVGVRRVVLAGVFADVCLDAAARTAFQKGFEVEVVRDGTLALERDLDEALGFMQRFYGATVTTRDELARRWSKVAPP